MPHETLKVAGRIGDVFVHRFVIETPTGEKILADLGPKGLDIFPLQSGTEIVASGEMKPSELKVAQISRSGEAPVRIPHKPKPHDHREHPDADPAAAVKAVRKAGFEPLGQPRRKPTHFEVLGRRGHAFVECHVEFDGHIRKEKPVAPHDDKWAADIRKAA